MEMRERGVPAAMVAVWAVVVVLFAAAAIAAQAPGRNGASAISDGAMGVRIPPEVDALVRGALGRDPVPGEQAAVELPDGHTITIEWTDLGWVREHEAGSGTGAGAEFSGDKLVTDFSGSAPSVGSAGVSGGSSSGSSRGSALTLPEGVGSTPLLWAGVLLLVAAGAGGWFLRSVKFGLVFGGIGGVLIAVGLYPALALWGVLGAIAIAVVYALRSDAVAARFRESTRALVGAIDHPTVEPDAKTAVAGALAMEADARDKAVIESVRVKDAPLKFAGT